VSVVFYCRITATSGDKTTPLLQCSIFYRWPNKKNKNLLCLLQSSQHKLLEQYANVGRDCHPPSNTCFQLHKHTHFLLRESLFFKFQRLDGIDKWEWKPGRKAGTSAFSSKVAHLAVPSVFQEALNCRMTSAY
jgi:hypothetical protein